MDNIPEALRQRNRWVLFDEQKAPVQPNGYYARSTQPTTWTTFDQAVAALKVFRQYGGLTQFKGVGLVVVADDDLVGIDLDKIDLEGRGERAAEIQKRFSQTYQERSPSGRGVRIWVQGRLPWSGAKNDKHGIEVYQDKRYLTVTGDRINEADVVHDQEAIDWLVSTYFAGHKEVKPGERREYNTEIGEALADEIRDHLRKRPGTTCGRDASGACLKVVSDVVHGFALDAEDALPFLLEWGERADQQDEYGHYSPWTEKEIAHKITSALRKGPDREPGWLIPVWWYSHQHEDEIAAMVKPWTGPTTTNKPVNDSFDPDKYKTTKPETKRRRKMTAADIENMPDPEWLVRRHLTAKSLTVLAGPPGSCKSFWSLHLALAVATGNTFLGQFRVRPGSVAYVYSEGESGLKYRLRAWKQFHKTEIPGTFGVYPYRYDLLNRDEAIGIIEQMAEDYGGMPELVIIDTLARNYGSGDENSTKDMNAFVASVDMIRATGAAVLLIHHTGKDASRGERGSSVLRAAVDNLILTERVENQMYLTCEKMKDGSPFSRYVLDLVPQVVGVDQDGEEIDSIALNYAGAFTDQKQTKERLECEEWVAKLPAGTVTVKDGERAWNVARSTAQTRLDKLASEGFLSKVDGSRYPQTPAKYMPKSDAGGSVA